MYLVSNLYRIGSLKKKSLLIPQTQFLGYNIFNGTLSEILYKGKITINTLNQYSYCLAENDTVFKSALSESDVLLPDGVSIVLSAKFLNGSEFQKIAGADVHDFILNYLNSVYGSCFYLGSSLGTISAISQKIKENFPNVRMSGYSPSFCDEFSVEENELMLDKINEFMPDVLFVGMTAPKQEKWVHQNKNRIHSTIICSIGAVFDFFSEKVERPNSFWIEHGLEWMIRFVNEPRRLWKRYLLYGAIFVKYIVKEKFRNLIFVR